jgi:hypothetical protein
VNPKLAVVAFPIFSSTDRATLQTVRATHDPQFARLDPHFTLVFPVEAPLDQVVAEIRSTARAVAAFTVTLESVQAVRDVFGAEATCFWSRGKALTS